MRTLLRTACFLPAMLATVGCSSIPSNTPLLLDKTTQRIDDRKEVVLRVLQATIDESGFARVDLEDARKKLEGISTVNLTPNDKKAVEEGVKAIAAAEKSLARLSSDERKRVPEDSRRIFDETIASLRMIRQIIGTETDKKAVVQDMIDLLEKAKEKKQ